MNSTKIIILVFLTALGALLISACGAALVPQMSYQGVLTNENGQPLNGNVQFTYRLFDTGTGGTALYSETETVAVTDGLFNSVVGPSTIVAGLTPEDLTKPLFMEIQVANGVYTETLTPRQRLYGSPYAFTLMPGAVISSTIGGILFDGGPINAVTTIRNEYVNVEPDDRALPALRLIGDVNLELVDRAGGESGTIYTDRANPDSDLYVRTSDRFYIHLDEDDNDVDEGVVIYNGDNNIICQIDQVGNLTCDGTKSATVRIADEDRLLYAVESPGVWFEDFGAGVLADGEATITIEPLFAQSVNLAVDYHVFLTPLGECNGLYVAKKTPTGFTVRELNGGSAEIAFDYRIVAKRIGYEAVRLELANVDMDEE